MRMVFSEVVGTLSFLQPQADDDMADRLHYYYTTTFLLVTSVLISLKMYGGRPIECWMPAEYQNSWQEYTEIYCFSMNTYFASFSADIPNETEKRERNMISYYQWTPFFLVICAFLFYSPCLIWRVLYTKSGIRIKDIVAFANDRSNIQPKMREANMKGMSAHLGSVFRHRFRLGGKHPYHHKFLRVLNLRFYEAYLTFLYIGIKMLFLGNVTVQMFLMNWFLQTSNYRYYGFGVLQDLIYGRPWSDSGNFPRVTYCDLDVRILGNVQKHTVQCVLVINIYIEKVFVLLWIWYSLLLVVTLFSLVNWIFSSFPFEARKRFIARRLELADVEFKRANFEEELEDFVRYHIKMDGVFMLRMLTIHAGILVCTEVVDAMWEEFIDGLAGASERAKSLTESAVIASPASAASSLPPAPFRRKMSVLVPLVSAQPDGQHQSGFSFLQHQSLSGSLNVHQQEAQPSGSAAISSAGAGLGAASTLVPKGEFHLKRPNALEWRTGRRLHSAGDAKKGSLDTSVGSSNGGRRRYPRRTSHGVPMLSAVFGGALATLTRARSHSATQQPLEQVEEGQVSQPPPTHRPQRARRDLLETHSDVEEVVELLEEEEHQRQREEEERERNSSSSTWHGGAAQRRAK